MAKKTKEKKPTYAIDATALATQMLQSELHIRADRWLIEKGTKMFAEGKAGPRMIDYLVLLGILKEI